MNAVEPSVTGWTSPSGLRVECLADGTLRSLAFGDVHVNLFVGNALEGGPANLVLRRHEPAGAAVESTPLLGPRSATRWRLDAAAGELEGAGEWQGLRYRVLLRLAASAPAWFWHVRVENAADAPLRFDLQWMQDLALAPYAAVRLNEFYVSQYLDHTPLAHPERGVVLASRQNQAVGTTTPWCVIGSLNRAVAHATDALQVHGLASRAGLPAPGRMHGLPATRLQHEHAMAALQDAASELAPGESAALGWFGRVQADHPQPTSSSDLAVVDATLALPEAQPPSWRADPPTARPEPSLFATAPLLAALELDEPALEAIFGTTRRHPERAADGRLLAFFHGENGHVALRAKELAVLRPHGQVLRTGTLALPDESALTSTVWMGGVFHSMLTQGHVSINRCLSTVRSYLGLFRSQGLRLFVEVDGAWQLLDQPSAFEMTPEACRWVYRHAGGRIDVRSRAHSEPHGFGLELEVVDGPALRCLVCLHVALNGDDGSTPGRVHWSRDGEAVLMTPAPKSELGQRFPQGHFRIEPSDDTAIERVAGDDALFPDGVARELPYLTLTTAPARAARFMLRGRFVDGGPDVPAADAVAAAGRLGAPLDVQPPAGSAVGAPLARLMALMPWLRQNALVHYLAPRGLEQFSGGGWGTRDVCQGPVELLLAQGHGAPMRDLLLRVMKAQRTDGDWPQWFMFFERDAAIRAGDSHGDIVFWPLLALAQYLIATGDASILDERVRFYPSRASRPGAAHSVWDHVLRALALTRRRTIAGTALAAYGHGDWNDSLQPANPAMRERLCRAWTVTLHHQTLTTLASVLRRAGRVPAAKRLEREAAAVRGDFTRLLLVDEVLAGYALFGEHGADGSEIHYLLHPRDRTTGVRYSALAMIHAILEGLFDEAQMRHHLRLIDEHLSGPDGARLFDRPLDYHGGTQRHFQRAETATFFGREIGLMYTHAHLRYAQALAHVGDAERFFHALCQANPIGLSEIVPMAAMRPSNCYYSSSDAQFVDRYQASAEYDRVRAGTIALDGGWRVYSSGAGILYALVVRHLFGLRLEADALLIDPVLPVALDGTRVRVSLSGRDLEIVYRVRGAGCGVRSLQLDGKALEFGVEANPYRRGAARVSLRDMAAALATPQTGQLTVDVGEAR
jgi:cellobiose phosphorylase